MSNSFINLIWRLLHLWGINPTVKQTTNGALLCVLLFIAGTLNNFAQTGTWVQKSDLGYDTINVPEPTARSGAVGFSIGSKGYLGTGFDGSSTFYKDFWAYDSATNTWTQKADFGGTARVYAVGFSIGTKGYIGTGGYKDFWEYDPATNKWTRKANFGGGVRSGAVGFSIGTKGYIGTGSNNSSYYKDFWEYDPATNTWTQKVDFGGNCSLRCCWFQHREQRISGYGTNWNCWYRLL